MKDLKFKVGDTIHFKGYPKLGGTICKITKDYVFYDDFDGVRKMQSIHKSNIHKYIKKLDI